MMTTIMQEVRSTPEYRARLVRLSAGVSKRRPLANWTANDVITLVAKVMVGAGCLATVGLSGLLVLAFERMQ